MTNTQQSLKAIIEERLTHAFAPSHLEVIDDGADHIGHAGNTGKGYFTVHVVSDKFSGQNTVKRHRMIYAALGELMQHDIHAISIKAKAPHDE